MRFFDIDQMMEVANGARYSADYMQLQPGALRARSDAAAMGDISVIHKRVNQSIECLGSPRPGCVSFLLSLREAGPLVNSQQLQGDHAGLVRAGGDLALLCGGDGLELLSLAVPVPLLADRVSAGSPGVKLREGDSFRCLRMQPADRMRILSAVDAHTQEGLTNEVRSELEELVLGSLADLLQQHTHSVGGSPDYHRSREIFGRARAYIADHIESTIRIDVLASHAMTSQRTLERVFRRETGMTPRRYIMARRLELARRTLGARSGSETPVSTAALGAGFFHLGRFSNEFRRQFGILPSELRSLSGYERN